MKKLENIKHLSNEQSQSLKYNFGHMAKELLTNEHKNAKNQNLQGTPTQSSNLQSHCISTAPKKYVHKASIRSWPAP